MAFKTLRLTMHLCILMWTAYYAEGRLTEIKIHNYTNCGPPDKTWELKIVPWPVVTSKTGYIVTVTFTPAVDVLAASINSEFKSLKDGTTFRSYEDNACKNYPKFCGLPANETQTLKHSDYVPHLPQEFQVKNKSNGSWKLTGKAYNQENVLWFCLEGFGDIL
ncbi:uncharacterized protein LOC144634232 [Oculina patagonica]